MSATNIQIAVKVRPLIERELKDKVEPLWLIKENSIVHIDSAHNFIGEPYSFDQIFDQRRTNKEVYDAVVKPLVMSCLEGINSTIFAYGQTSSGKTHTMLGDQDVPGIIMYTFEDIFKHIEETPTKNFLLRCSYLEIYNEKINDLLDTKAKDLKIREDYDQMVHVLVKEEVIRESNELLVLMKKGMKTRKIGCTDMNERSSRSHTIFKLVIQSQNKDSEGSYTESCLSLVDLAGSERVGQMNMKGERQAEGVSINKSLTTLGLVIRKLSENEQFINYRDSKLTRLLQHSLGGNSRTLIICTITVAAAEETKSTLEFAQRAKYVKNRPIINERVTDKDQLKQYAHLCQDYKGQIEKLRLEKLERDKTINALEDKISNIRLFTSGDFEKTVKVSKIPQRRHTLGYYKPFITKPLAPILDSEGSDESSDEDDPDKHDSPLKSGVLFTITDEDEKENVNFDTIACTPSNASDVPKTPKAPTTPSSVLKMQKGLLEESYSSLKTFTNYEKQLMGNYDEIKELKELTDKLRNENIELRQQSIKENQQYFKVAERNKEIFDQLILLRSILEGRPVEEIRQCLAKQDEELKTQDKCSPQEHILEQINQHSFLEEENYGLKSDLENITFQICDKQREIQKSQQLDEKTLVITGLEKETLHLKEYNISNRETDTSQEVSDYKFSVDSQQKLERKVANLVEDNAEVNEKVHEEIDLQQTLANHSAEIKALQDKCSAQECQLSQYSFLEIENYRLKSELENVMFQLSNKQKQVEIISQELDENVLVSASLEKERLLLKEHIELSELEIKKSQELSSINVTLQEALRIKEEETKTLEEKYKFLDQGYTETQQQLQQTALLLNEKNEALNNLVACNNVKTVEFEALVSRYSELKTQIEILSQDNHQQELKQKIVNLGHENAELKEKVKEYVGLGQSLAQHAKTVETLKDKCSTQEHQLQSYKEQLNNTDLQLENYKEQLNNKIVELDEKSQLYNNILTNYAAKNVEIECLETENENLKNKVDQLYQKQEESKEFRQLLEKENVELKHRLDKNVCLQTKLDEYALDITILKDRLASLEIQLNNLRTQLNTKTLELDAKMIENKCLIQENTELKNQLNTLSLKQSALEVVQQEIKGLKDKNSYLKQQVDQLSNSNREINSQLTRVTTDLNIKTVELDAKVIENKCLIQENTEFKNQLNTLSLKQSALEVVQQEIKGLKDENFYLKQQVDELSNSNREINSQLTRVTTDLNTKTLELDAKMIKNKSLIQENTELKNQLNTLSLKQSALEVIQQEIKGLKDKKSYLKQQVDQLTNSNREINLQLTRVTSDLNTKTVELDAKLIENKCLIQENTELKNQLNTLSLKQSALEVIQQEIKGLKDKKSYLKQQVDQLTNSNREIDLQLTRVTTDLNTKTVELDAKMIENKCLIQENTELKNQLNTLPLKQSAHELIQQEIKGLKDEKSYLKQQVDQLSNSNREINLQLTRVITDLNTKQQEIKCLKKALNEKAEEIMTFEKDKAKQTKKMEVALLDMKRHLDKRSEELSHLKGKYNALEIQLYDCKDLLKAKAHELLLEKNTELKYKLENLTLMLNQVQNENKLKTVQLKSASEEIQTLKQNVFDVTTLQAELAQHKIKLQNIHKNYEGSVLLKNTISKLTDEKHVLEKKLSKSQDKVMSLDKMLNSENQYPQEHCQSKQELYICNEHANILESQLKLEKSKVESLTQKLQLCESEIDNLQAKINDLIQYRKRIQEKILDGTLKEVPVPRLSDEGRPLSPNELRKIKRQSIHDQRRGLSLDSSDSLELTDIDCPDCQDLRTKFKRVLEKNRRLLGDIEDIRKNNDYLKWENEYMTEKNKEMDLKIKELDENVHSSCDKIINCSGCKELRTKLGKIEEQNKKLRTEIENLKQENASLDRENEDMLKIIKEMEQSENDLHNQLQSYKTLADCSSGNDELRLLQIKYNDIITKKADLEKELLHNGKLIMKYKNKIANMESDYLETEYKHKNVKKELRKNLNDCHSIIRRTLPSVEDKETQATCDLHEKYKKIKKLAQIRRQEGNFLRAKLNLSPDCAVLPEDIQRQPTNV